MENKVNGTCLGFGWAFDALNIECISCQKDFPEEYVVCVDQTKQLTSKPRQSNSKPKKKRVKALDGTPLVSMCRKEIESGKSPEEVRSLVENAYLVAGKDKKYAQMRACSLYWYVNKTMKKEVVDEAALS